MDPLRSILNFILGEKASVSQKTPTGNVVYEKEIQPSLPKRIEEFISNLLPKKELLSPVVAARPTATPTPTSAPTATPFPRNSDELQRIISSGLVKSGFGKAPVARHTSEFARAGSQLPETIDPRLPIILSLMESGGGQDPIPSQANNPFNIFYPGSQNPVYYPNITESLFGPEGSNETLNLLGILREGGPYQDFRESGNLADFFTKYTPESDPSNPSTEELIRRFNKLAESFQ